MHDFIRFLYASSGCSGMEGVWVTCAIMIAWMCGSQKTSSGVGSLYCVSPGNESQVSSLSGKHPHPLSHLKCPLELHSLICFIINHCAGMHTWQECTCGGQGTIWKSWSSSIMWVPKVRLGSSDLGSSSRFRMLYHLIALFGF